MNKQNKVDPFTGLTKYVDGVPIITNMVKEIFKDLTGPKQCQAKDGTSLNIFSGAGDLEIHVFDKGVDEVVIELQITPTGRYFRIHDHAALVDNLGIQWNWGACRDNGQWRYHLATKLRVEELGGSRNTLLREQLKQVRLWHAEVSPLRTPTFDLRKIRALYESYSEVLVPVVPWQYDGEPGKAMSAWAERVAQLVYSGLAVAVPAESTVEQELALAVLAQSLFHIREKSLGMVIRSSLDGDRLLQAVTKAPGIVAVPVRILQMTINAYQLGNEMHNVLESLSGAGAPCVFYGSYSELQGVFQGGQGAVHDPLKPVVSRLPDLPLAVFIAFAVECECCKKDIVSVSAKRDMCIKTAEALDTLDEDNARRLVKQTAAYVVQQAVATKQSVEARKFVSFLDTRVETLGGLNHSPQITKISPIRKKMIECFTDPGFLSFLTDNLVGQDDALQEISEKLMKEALTRPPHQPLRIALVGEPGTGKSQCLVLLAKKLNMIFEGIDMAQFSCTEMAKTQLFGSSPGYVGSNEAGRLEHIAKNFTGVVVECSDLDHAHPTVQREVGDCFLSIFESGTAQNGKGQCFSCANTIFGFTLNLPEGKDERMFHRTGFGNAPSREEVQRNVRRELKGMISGAFWSRMGDPVLFCPINEHGACVEILRRALADGARSVLRNFGVAEAQVTVETQTAAHVMATGMAPGAGSNARGLLDLGRACASEAVLTFMRSGPVINVSAFELVVDNGGRVVMRLK